MATNITPLHDRVIVRRIEDNVNQTAGGLFIPDTAKEKPQEGEVIAAGQGKYKEDGTRQALDVKAGDEERNFRSVADVIAWLRHWYGLRSNERDQLESELQKIYDSEINLEIGWLLKTTSPDPEGIALRAAVPLSGRL